LTKEIIKDVNGQQIVYYPISEKKTTVHDVYNEAQHKVFDQPIAVDAVVDAQFHEGTHINQFGIDQVYKIEVFLHYRDLIEKGINVNVGDFFSFSDIFYEITNANIIKNIFGQAEHRSGIKITGTKARKGQFDSALFGPTDISHTDPTAVQKKFVQQRGEESNSEGPTGDKRAMVEAGVIDLPSDGPREVSEKGAAADNSHYASSFYSDTKK